MPLILKNNVASTLATAASDTDTAIVVTDGSLFPALTGTDYFYATLTSTSGTVEIVKATARVGNVLTVVRGQDDTTPAIFQVGARVEMRVNAASVKEANTVVLEVIDGMGPAADPLQGTDFLPIAQGAGNPRNTTLTGLRNWLLSSSAALSGELSFVGVDHRGLRLLNLTTAQRDVISGWASGHILYNETTNEVQFRRGSTSSWEVPLLFSDSSTVGRQLLNTASAAAGRTTLGAAPLASPAFTGNGSIAGNFTVGGTLGVTGATTLSSTLGVTGATTLSSTLDVTGATTLSSTLGVTGAATLNSTLAVTGAITASASINLTGNIVGGGTNLSGNMITAGNVIASGTNHSYGSNVPNALFNIIAQAGTQRSVRLFSGSNLGSALRWVFGVPAGAESGSNVGAEFVIAPYDDTGVFLGNAIRINRSGPDVFFPLAPTVVGTANAILGTNNVLQKSSSSLVYKRDIETIDDWRVDNFFAQARPVWFRSRSLADNPHWGFYGFIAEEIAAIDNALAVWDYQADQYEVVEWTEDEVTTDADGNTVTRPVARSEKRLKPNQTLRPNSVMYDRIPAFLVNKVQRQQRTIENLEARVASLEARLNQLIAPRPV